MKTMDPLSDPDRCAKEENKINKQVKQQQQQPQKN